ncbi:hypothetical protein [Mumia sp. Pv 4-285]|uniref:hypothetical protein n=1 Tax=Mumia qirimensis TaxID=3234852 RepID=UPI00351DA2CE
MSVSEWERVDASAWIVRQVEPVGSTPTNWVEDPVDSSRWLHKDTFIPANGVEQGEDWAEVVSTQVGALLGAPCAKTRLCTRNGRRGSLSLSVLPEGHSLWEGHVALTRAGIQDYFPHIEGNAGVDPSRPLVKRPGHTLPNILIALSETSAPSTFSGPTTLDGFDVFVGYLILDALVANRDRHEQNWAVLTPQLISQPEQLAPSYDHAGSLGYNLTDERRMRCLDEPLSLHAWALNGTAHRFEHRDRPRTLVDHATHGLSLCSHDGGAWWMSRIMELDLRPVLEPVRQLEIPEMSVAAATFACELLELNLRRLQDAISGSP